MENNAVIPIDRTQVPVEYDELRDSINRILTDLGPTQEQPKGPFGDVIESFSDGLAGKGEQINKTLNGLSEALTTLNEGRGDFFGVVKSLALFVNALLQERSAVRRAEQRPRAVHQLVHQHRPRGRRRRCRISTSC